MDLYNVLTRELHAADLIKDAPMSMYTSMRVGGPADCLLCAANQDEICTAISAAKVMSQPVTLIGNGTNLIVRDGGVRGLVVRIADRFRGIEFDDERVRVLSGTTLAALARACAEQGLAGMEFASGIPGTLGGAVCMNAGAYGGEMRHIVDEVTALDAELSVIRLDNEGCAFGYRSSSIRDNGYIALNVVLKLTRGDKQGIYTLMEELGHRRRTKQPLNMPSAGSVFKRPPGDFAGRLIEESGMKGACLGGAMVSPVHANFIVNAGGASAADVLGLMEMVRERVADKSGVLLESELCVIGSDAHV